MGAGAKHGVCDGFGGSSAAGSSPLRGASFSEAGEGAGAPSGEAQMFGGVAFRLTGSKVFEVGRVDSQPLAGGDDLPP